jgi:hypothetical protein
MKEVNLDFNFAKDKRCPRCDERKPRDEFYDCDRSKSGLSSWCMECTRERRNERYAEQQGWYNRG